MKKIIVPAGRHPLFVACGSWLRFQGGRASPTLHAQSEPGEYKTLCGENAVDVRFTEPVEDVPQTFCGICVGMVRERMAPKDAIKDLRADSERMSQLVMAMGPRLTSFVLAAAESAPIPAPSQARGGGRSAGKLLCPEDGKPCTCANMPADNAGLDPAIKVKPTGCPREKK